MRARIIALPRRGIPYVDCLYSAIADPSVEILDGQWAGHWPLLKVRRRDLVHIHWPSFYYYDPRSRFRTWWRLITFMVRLLLVRALGARIAWTAHNLYPHDGGRDERAHHLGRRFLCRIAQTIFVHGPTAAAIVANEWRGARAKLVPIPHGHWIDHYPNSASKQAARDRLGISSTAYVYGFVGQCRPYKNLEHLIDSFARCGGDSVLLIAGSFKSRDYLAAIRQRLATLAPATQHFEPRFVGDDELQYYLAACDALVIPYREILTSGSALLALSFGRPVIAPNIGGLRDIIDDSCGQLYDPADADGLLRAMQAARQLQTDPAKIIARVRSLRWTDAAAALLQALHANNKEHS